MLLCVNNITEENINVFESDTPGF